MTSVEELQKKVQYWKKHADDYKQNYDACKQELDEFQTSSRELEVEMETQLEQSEKKVNELKSLTARQKSDLDGLRDKYNALQAQFGTEISRMEEDLEQTRFERDEAQRCIRELETMNDDLERAKRALVASLDDFEKRMNDAIERNAFLESELDEKDLLATSVQRLKDETKDLKQELLVRETVRERMDSHRSSGSRPPSLSSTTNPSSPLSKRIPSASPGSSGNPRSPSYASGQSLPLSNGPACVAGSDPGRSSAFQQQGALASGSPSGKHLPNHQHQLLTGIPSPGCPPGDHLNNPATSNLTSLPITNGAVVTPPTRATVNGIRDGMPRSRTIDEATLATSPFTPSARISALNIVGDLLRKVGALESKLATCRKYAADRELEKSNGTSTNNAKLRSMSMTTSISKGKLNDIN